MRQMSIGVALAAAFLAGCDRKDQEQRPQGQGKPADRATAAKPQDRPAGTETMFFPTGVEDGSPLKVDKVMPKEVWAGEAFTETVTITNVSPKELHHITITERMSPNFKPSETSGAEIRGEVAVWHVGTLKAGESRTFTLSGTPQDEGEIRHCTQVGFQPELCTAAKVAVPKLEVALEGPREVLICDPIAVRAIVRNGGTAHLPDVKLEGPLPEGLKMEDGSKEVAASDIGTLGPGESKEIQIRLKADHRGTFPLHASARSKGIAAEANAEVVVREPVLAIETSATPATEQGGPARSEVTVQNRGDGPAPETVVRVEVPQGVKVVAMNPEGRTEGNAVTWDLGTVGPGENRKLSLEFTSGAPGTVSMTIRAKGHCAPEVQGAVATEFRGIPAVLLEVVDDPDPVAVGGSVTYSVTITNQGTVPLSNIRLTCGLEPAMEYVSSDGPSREGRHDESRVEFQPMASLEPKASATWKIAVKARSAADVRFKASVTTHEVPRPVEETESTHFVVQTR